MERFSDILFFGVIVFWAGYLVYMVGYAMEKKEKRNRELEETLDQRAAERCGKYKQTIDHLKGVLNE